MPPYSVRQISVKIAFYNVVRGLGSEYEALKGQFVETLLNHASIGSQFDSEHGLTSEKKEEPKHLAPMASAPSQFLSTSHKITTEKKKKYIYIYTHPYMYGFPGDPGSKESTC